MSQHQNGGNGLGADQQSAWFALPTREEWIHDDLDEPEIWPTFQNASAADYGAFSWTPGWRHRRVGTAQRGVGRALLASTPALRTIIGMFSRPKKQTSNGPGGNDTVSALHFRELTDETWKDFEKLFESRGGPKICWCMVWRGTGEEAARTDGTSRKAAMKKRVHAGVPVGILGYIGERPVAWCSIAPRGTYRASMAEAQNGDAEGSVWSVVCFFVSRSVRGQGAFYSLLEAAEAHAKACGATVLEGYPVDEDSPSYRFGGFLPSFDKAGFTPIGRAGTRRHVVRKGSA